MGCRERFGRRGVPALDARAHHIARWGAQAAMIVAPEGTADSALVPPAAHKASATAHEEALQLQHVNIPVGLVTLKHGAHACLPCMYHAV